MAAGLLADAEKKKRDKEEDERKKAEEDVQRKITQAGCCLLDLFMNVKNCL